MAELNLRGKDRLVAVVDDADIERVMLGRWWLSTHASGERYIVGRVADPGVRTPLIYLHHYLTEPPPGAHVTFANGNTLDCRRSNLLVNSRSSSHAGDRP
jgi:hypothetical protein